MASDPWKLESATDLESTFRCCCNPRICFFVSLNPVEFVELEVLGCKPQIYSTVECNHTYRFATATAILREDLYDINILCNVTISFSRNDHAKPRHLLFLELPHGLV